MVLKGFWGIPAIRWPFSRDSLGSIGFFEQFQVISKEFLGSFGIPGIFWPFSKDSEWF